MREIHRLINIQILNYYERYGERERGRERGREREKLQTDTWNNFSLNNIIEKERKVEMTCRHISNS